MMERKHYIYLGLIVVVLSFTIIFFGAPKAFGEDSGAWEYKVPKLTNPVSNSYFAETGWRQIKPWEIEQCTRKLSSEITTQIERVTPFSVSDITTGTGTTLQAMKQTFYDTTYYEIAWYIEPETDLDFSMIAYDDKNEKIKKVVVENEELKAHNGEGHYTAWEDTANYTRIKLILGDTSSVFKIVDKEN